jgi:hypothetical protein
MSFAREKFLLNHFVEGLKSCKIALERSACVDLRFGRASALSNPCYYNLRKQFFPPMYISVLDLSGSRSILSPG